MSERTLLREIAQSGIEHGDKRSRYVTVQIDRGTWDQVQALAAERSTPIGQDERIEVVRSIPSRIGAHVGKDHAEKILAALDAYDREQRREWPELDLSAIQCRCGRTMDEPCGRERRGLLGIGRLKPDPCRPQPVESPGRDGEKEAETPQEQWARESNEHQANFEADQVAGEGRDGGLEVETGRDQWSPCPCGGDTSPPGAPPCTRDNPCGYAQATIAVEGRDGEDDREWTPHQILGLVEGRADETIRLPFGFDEVLVPKSSRDARDREIERLENERDRWAADALRLRSDRPLTGDETRTIIAVEKQQRRRAERAEGQVEKLRDMLEIARSIVGAYCEQGGRVGPTFIDKIDAALASSNSDGETDGD